MKIFEIKKGRQGFEKLHADKADAEDWAASYNWHDPEAELSVIELGPIPAFIPTVQQRKDFGKQVVQEYEEENDLISSQVLGRPFTIAEIEQEFAKFDMIKKMLESGALVQALEKLQLIPVDAAFTQERKDKYILRIQNWLQYGL